MPAGMREVGKLSGNIEGVRFAARPLSRNPQRAHQQPRMFEVECGLQGAMHIEFLARNCAGQVEIGDAGLNAIKRGRAEGRRSVSHEEQRIVGREIERQITVLVVETCGSAVVVEAALLDRNVPGMEFEELVDCRLRRALRQARVRLIRRSVGIDDQVQAGPVDLQAAQPDVGAV